MGGGSLRGIASCRDYVKVCCRGILGEGNDMTHDSYGV